MIYILAQGKGDRWDTVRNPNFISPAEYKQQIPINGESLIFRTIRLIQKYSQENYKVVAEKRMFSHPQLDFLEANNKIFTLCYAGTILEGIHSILNEHPTTESATFLLGDVVFSKTLLKTILTTDLYALFGRTGENPATRKQAAEIFAIKAPISDIEKFKAQINVAKNYPATKLWHFYRNNFDGWYINSFDYTDDIDSPDEYIKFFSKLEEAAKQDE